MGSIDLHVHSGYSADGELAPAQIVQLAQEKGVRLLSITDHNSVRGVREAQVAADEVGLNFVSGIEVDALFEGQNLHVLGYGVDAGDAGLDGIEAHALGEEAAAFPLLIRKLNDLGFSVNKRAVLDAVASGIPAPEDIAAVILADEKLKTDSRLDPYRKGGEKSDMPNVNFYYDWCANGKAAYVEKKYPSLPRVISVIKDAGGIPVLAHPGASLREPEKQLPDLVKEGIEGLEVFSSYHSEEQTRSFLNQAETHGLIITCGSDFHGKNKPGIDLGSTGCPEFEQRIFDRFISP